MPYSPLVVVAVVVIAADEDQVVMFVMPTRHQRLYPWHHHSLPNGLPRCARNGHVERDIHGDERVTTSQQSEWCIPPIPLGLEKNLMVVVFVAGVVAGVVVEMTNVTLLRQTVVLESYIHPTVLVLVLLVVVVVLVVIGDMMMVVVSLLLLSLLLLCVVVRKRTRWKIS